MSTFTLTCRQHCLTSLPLGWAVQTNDGAAGGGGQDINITSFWSCLAWQWHKLKRHFKEKEKKKFTACITQKCPIDTLSDKIVCDWLTYKSFILNSIQNLHAPWVLLCIYIKPGAGVREGLHLYYTNRDEPHGSLQIISTDQTSHTNVQHHSSL